MNNIYKLYFLNLLIILLSVKYISYFLFHFLLSYYNQKHENFQIFINI